MTRVTQAYTLKLPEDLDFMNLLYPMFKFLGHFTLKLVLVIPTLISLSARYLSLLYTDLSL